MEKMTISEFTETIDGMVNDYINFVTDEKQFKTNIVNLMIKVLEPCLDNKGKLEYERNKI